MRLVIEGDLIDPDMNTLGSEDAESDETQSSLYEVGLVSNVPGKFADRDYPLIEALRALCTGEALFMPARSGRFNIYGREIVPDSARSGLRDAANHVIATRATLEDATVTFRTRIDNVKGGFWGWFELPGPSTVTGGHAEV